MKLGRHSEMCQCLEVWISELEALRNESCGILVFCCRKGFTAQLSTTQTEAFPKSGPLQLWSHLVFEYHNQVSAAQSSHVRKFCDGGQPR